MWLLTLKKQETALSQIIVVKGRGGGHTIIFGLPQQLQRRAKRHVLNPEHALQIPLEVAANTIVIQRNS